MYVLLHLLSYRPRLGRLISFHFIYYFTGYEKKQLQNETDIKSANMFKWYNDYTWHNYTK